MDWLTFFSKVIEALAWPSVVGGLLLYLRKDLPKLVASLRKLKFKEMEVEFGEAAKKVAIETSAAVPLPGPDTKLSGESEEEIERQLRAIAELSPRAAILEAWLRVEAAAVSVIRKHGSISLNATPGPLRLREGLEVIGVLTPPQVAAYDSLRRLRNEAVHTPDAEFTPTAVANFIQAALSMAAYLEAMAQ